MPAGPAFLPAAARRETARAATAAAALVISLLGFLARRLGRLPNRHAGAVVRDGGANERLQRRLVHRVTLVKVNGAAGLGVEPGVEQTVRVGQRCALEEVQLDVVLERAGRD